MPTPESASPPSGPKARSIPAWGAAPGKRGEDFQRAGGLIYRFSTLRHSFLAILALLLTLPLTACRPAIAAADPNTPTLITLTPTPLHTGGHRLGINLSGQSFYDSGQLLRNLTFRNPGFEGETWQSILHCKTVAANTCTDENQYTTWPANFMEGAHYEDLNTGTEGTILAQSPSENGHGVTLTLQTRPSPGDFLLLRLPKPGHAEAGWWTGTEAGATLLTEFHDLPPATLGKQALRIEAATGSATVSSYFDSFNGRSFLQLRGTYTLRFRAKGLSPGASTNIEVSRLDTTHGLHTFFSHTQPLPQTWHDYTYTFTANEPTSALGTVGLTFRFSHTSALLDDVSLTEAAAPDNPTPFRNAVVSTLRTLRPGVLRYMDSGGNFGSSFLNMIVPVPARERTGSSTQETTHEDIPLGLHEFLQLCQAVGAEPWYSMPPGTSPAEAAATIEYLAGPATTPYGARRAALGHPRPWTADFPTLHLELGNEQWNARSFYGSTLNDPTAYAHRASAVFAATRRSPYFAPQSFDLIEGSWAAVPWWTAQQLAGTTGADTAGADTVALAPYLFTDFRDASSPEAIFGPMFAQPQQLDGPNGLMAQQLKAAGAHKLAVYETNLGTIAGTVPQSALDSTVPSLGAGLAVLEHMLLMKRDLGIDTQCLFALPQYLNNFTAADGSKRTIPLWGAVVDMGGPTDLRRPTFLAEQLANSAILPTELRVDLQSPIWRQPKSPNNSIELANARLLEAFSYTDGPHHSLLLLNLSRTEALPVHLAGVPAHVTEQQLSAPLTANNEHTEQVQITHRPLTLPSSYPLPPHSITVLTW